MRRTWLSLLTAFAFAGAAVADTGGSSDKLGKKIETAFADPAGKPFCLVWDVE